MAYEAIDPQPEEVAPRLARLDLVLDDLLIPVRAGVAARRTATAHHPRAYSGWRDYGERVAALRDGLVPRAWSAAEEEGVCLTVHPEGRLAIMTAVGTSGTGTADDVTTRRSRGKVTEKIVGVNAQLELELHYAQPEPALRNAKTPTWVLLVCVEGDEVRSELSLAEHIDEDGYIDRWVDRIPLPVIRLNDLLDDEGPDEPPADADFDVPEL